MLKVNKIKKYGLAKYPQFRYIHNQGDFKGNVVKYGITPFLLIALLESCDGITGGGGTTGVPPPNELVTEIEARAIIRQVFENNNINLVEDFSIFFKQNQNDSMELILDGYNDSLDIGYEYAIYDDYKNFDSTIRSDLDSTSNTDGPYIKVIDRMEKHDVYQQNLENMTQQFIDTLKARGVI